MAIRANQKLEPWNLAREEIAFGGVSGTLVVLWHVQTRIFQRDSWPLRHIVNQILKENYTNLKRIRYAQNEGRLDLRVDLTDWEKGEETRNFEKLDLILRNWWWSDPVDNLTDK